MVDFRDQLAIFMMSAVNRPAALAEDVAAGVCKKFVDIHTNILLFFQASRHTKQKKILDSITVLDYIHCLKASFTVLHVEKQDFPCATLLS